MSERSGPVRSLSVGAVAAVAFCLIGVLGGCSGGEREGSALAAAAGVDPAAAAVARLLHNEGSGDLDTSLRERGAPFLALPELAAHVGGENIESSIDAVMTVSDAAADALAAPSSIVTVGGRDGPSSNREGGCISSCPGIQETIVVFDETSESSMGLSVAGRATMEIAERIASYRSTATRPGVKGGARAVGDERTTAVEVPGCVADAAKGWEGASAAPDEFATMGTTTLTAGAGRSPYTLRLSVSSPRGGDSTEVVVSGGWALEYVSLTVSVDGVSLTHTWPGRVCGDPLTASWMLPQDADDIGDITFEQVPCPIGAHPADPGQVPMIEPVRDASLGEQPFRVHRRRRAAGSHPCARSGGSPARASCGARTVRMNHAASTLGGGEPASGHAGKDTR